VVNYINPFLVLYQLEYGMHKKIVYIEDDIEMINLIKLILERKNYSFFSALGGQAGLELILEIQPDLILLDLMMPDVDGWDLYQQIKSNDQMKDIPVVIITAKAHPIDRILGIQVAKVDDYLTKPFKPQVLLDTIEKLLN
jgi:DNA-binding response OmpR family regulator